MPLKLPLPEIEKFYRFLVESLRDYGVIMMDTKGRIVTWNEGARKIFGYSKREVVGKRISLIFSAPDRRIGIPALEISTAKRKGRADDERQHRRKGGGLFWASGVMWAIKDGAGNLRGLSKLIRDITEQKAMEDKIRYQSLHDALTGLPNRRAFTDRLTLALSKARANNTMLALMSVDLDDFKRVNDTLGHDAGDILLQETASRLSSALRKGDSICRIGGDEFIILIDNVSRSRSIATRARNIRAVMKAPFDISNKKISMSVSVGTSFYPSDGKSSRTLQKQADVALYNAKAAGKSCHKTSRDRKAVGKRS